MKRAPLCVVALLALAACSCKPTKPDAKTQLPNKHSSRVDIDVSRLKTGMLFSEFEKTLGGPGDIQPQPSLTEAYYIFDLDNSFIVAAVRTQPKPEVVNQFWVRKDDLTADQRRAQRQKDASRAVIRPRSRE